MTVQLRSILAGASFLLSAVAYAADPVPPPATGFKVLSVPAMWSSKKSDDVRDTKAILDNVKKIIQGSPLSGSESQFEKYFQFVLFPQWTQTTEKNLNDLPKARDTFVKAFLEGSSRNDAAHALLVEVSHRELSKIAQDPEFHPAVRYHAIMIVGFLNETEPNRGAGGVRQMPEPYSKSLSTLLEELKKPDNNEAVRVGALLGVTRHLEWDNAKPAGSMTKIQPAIRAEILAELTSIVTTKAPPAGRSTEGQTWLRRRALEALGHANALTLDDSFAQLLEGIIIDDAEPISLRCTAAEVMSQIDYKAPVVLQIIPAAKRLGYLALYACHTELLRLESLKKKDEELVKITGGASGGMPGGMGGAGGGGTPGGAGGMTPGGSGGMTPGGAGGMTPGGGGGMMAGMSGMGKRGRGASGGKDGMLGGKLADPRAYRIDYSKRRLRTELYSVQLALGKKKKGAAEDPNATGLVSYAKAEPETRAVLDITTQVEAVIREVEAQNQDAATYEKNLRKEMKKLENMTKPLPVAAKTEVAKPAAGPEDELPAAAKPPTKAPPEDPAAEIPEAPPAKGAAEPAKAPTEPASEPVEPAAEAPADEGKALPADKNP